MGYPATILITTKNRRDELLRAVASAAAQRPRCEVLVIDDGSTDGSAAAVSAAFPDVRVVRHDASGGYVARRNQGVAVAAAPVVVSIDDDAEFAADDVVAAAVADFADPRVGVVAMPYVDVYYRPDVRQAAPGPAGVWAAHEFRGTAFAVRADVFARLGGFRAALHSQLEEQEFCLRLYDHGYVVGLGRGRPIHHFESPNRPPGQAARYWVRNAMRIAARTVPARYAFRHLGSSVAHAGRLARRSGRYRQIGRGLAEGLVLAAADVTGRRPVRPATFALWLELLRGGPRPLADIAARLPPLAEGGR